MDRKLYRFPVMMVAAALLGLCFFLTPPPAEAASTPWVRWEIELTFPNDQLDVQLVVQRGHTTQSGQHVIDDEKSYPLSCQAGGSPVIAGGQAHFDGSSYFQCSMPSVKQKAAQEWQMPIPDQCSAKRPYVTGMVTIEGSPVDATPSNPVFYRDDIQFNTPLDIATQQATLSMTIDQAAAASGAFNITAAGHDVGGLFSRSGPLTYSPSFRVDGINLSATPAVLTQPMIVSNLASTIYFGYSSASGEYFEGSLGPLTVDPVCPTTG